MMDTAEFALFQEQLIADFSQAEKVLYFWAIYKVLFWASLILTVLFTEM